MSRKKIILSAIFLLSISLLWAVKPTYASAEESSTICNGVFIDEVNVSGMTSDEAKVAVGKLVEELKGKGVAVTVGENSVSVTLDDLGYTTDLTDTIDQAVNLGKTGNLIKRYKDLKDIEQGSVVLPLTFTVDENLIKEVITTDVSVFNVAPIDATVSMENGVLVYTDHVVGSKVNVDETTKLVEDAISNWNREDIIVEAVVDEELPQYTKDIVEKCNTVLGEYTTDYSSSAWGRAANLANGAKLINNIVLYPDDTFSAYEVLSPFTEDNGYEVAGAYLQGKVIDSVGGGACQVTTTLYNAVLEAELYVVERQPHSMVIGYVSLSRDAAIAGTSKDFKFKNDSDVPILIEATTQNRKITFKIWGNETRDTKNREIKFESVVLSTTNPPKDVITEDPTQPITFEDVTTPAHTGYKAELYKIVYENGVEVSRTLVNSSNYQAAPKCITVGTKVEEEDVKDGKDGKGGKDGKDDPKPTDSAKDGKTDTDPDADINPDTNTDTNPDTNTGTDTTDPTDINVDDEPLEDIWEPVTN